MLKKHPRLLKFSAFLLALAPAIVSRNCAFLFIGEPEIPAKLKNN